MTRRLGVVVLGLLALGTSASPSMAGPYTQIFVFGDSLSDTGNVHIATGGARPPSPPGSSTATSWTLTFAACIPPLPSSPQPTTEWPRAGATAGAVAPKG